MMPPIPRSIEIFTGAPSIARSITSRSRLAPHAGDWCRPDRTDSARNALTEIAHNVRVALNSNENRR